jgi:malate dehydrogenase (oxaloacetate-decarboxylating)
MNTVEEAMGPKPSFEDLLAKARKPAEDALRLHPFYHGKLEMIPKCPITDLADFAIWYSPGVAAPCRDIEQHPERVFEHTNKGNCIAIVSDGTRVLGLGDIGPQAALPVMEGKALLFKYLGGVDAFPLCLATKDPDDIIQACKWLEPSFGGINLEDIAKPKCFYILDRLREELHIPVWHDDQQGTAAVMLAGLMNALKVVGKTKDAVKISMIGAGAANIAVSRILIAAGFSADHLIMVDTKGILHQGRDDLRTPENSITWHMCEISNGEGRTGGIPEAMQGTDVCIALSRPASGLIQPAWVASMAKDAIVFACANPLPEIWPWEAKDAGARVVATGRSDFPNQVNNALGLPAIFRGSSTSKPRTSPTRCVWPPPKNWRSVPRKKALRRIYPPRMDDWDVFPREAAAVGLKAIEQGVARRTMTKEALLEKASTLMKRARDATRTLMEHGIISKAG